MLDLKEKYFLASFRYNKTSPEDFKLKKLDGTVYYIDQSGNKWKQQHLWDSGWGNEYGFIRQPEPNFNELWELLTQSKIEENKLGAATMINEYYPEELKVKLFELFKSTSKIKRGLKKRLDLIELGVNRSETMGKHYKEIEQDYEDWKSLKTQYEKLK